MISATVWRMATGVFFTTTLYLLLTNHVRPDRMTLKCEVPVSGTNDPARVSTGDANELSALGDIRANWWKYLHRTRRYPAPWTRTGLTPIVSPDTERAQRGFHVDLARTIPKAIFLRPTHQLGYQAGAAGEVGTHALMDWVFKDNACVRGKGQKDWRTLDIGANEGMYSMLMASYGCRVISVEPQSACLVEIHLANLINDLKHPVDVRQNIISATPMKMNVSDGKCSGVSSYSPGEDNREQQWTSTEVSSLTLDELVKDEDVLMLHLDTEGAEPSIWLSGPRTFANRKVHNMVFECNPARYKKWGLTNREVAQALVGMIRAQKWTCRILNEYPSKKNLHDLSLVPTDTPEKLVAFFDSIDEVDVWCSNLEVPQGAGSL